MLRNATILGSSGMLAAFTASRARNRLRASPTISNCRSTADLRSSSDSYASSDLPAVNRAMRLAASSASQRYLRASGSIKLLATRVDRFAKVRVHDRAVRYQVDATLEDGFE